MPQADTHYRIFFIDGLNGLNHAGHNLRMCRVARSVGNQNPVWLDIVYLISRDVIRRPDDRAASLIELSDDIHLSAAINQQNIQVAVLRMILRMKSNRRGT